MNPPRALRLAPLVIGALLAGCQGDTPPVAPVDGESPAPTLLALGDSYTVGHSLPTAWSWPWQLADSLAASGDTLQAVDILARTGWTTRDLLEAIRGARADSGLATRPYGLVTLMIGVNNQFQGLDMEAFAAEMDTLIDVAVGLAGGDPRRVLGFSIPDYGVTPVGSRYGTQRVCDEIAAHNTILRRIFAARGIAMVDITPLSLAAATDPGLVAKDGLHYSRAMYARWVGAMLPDVRRILGPALAAAPAPERISRNRD